MLEEVEKSVEESLDYIETAKQDTKKAVSFQSQARRKASSSLSTDTYLRKKLMQLSLAQQQTKLL